MNDSSSPNELPRIGPGLGSRSSFWAKVRKRIIHENKYVQDASENEMLLALASGRRWLDMVPPEWNAIYGALHDESKYFMISESERTKIDKDIGRTFSLFTRNARLLRLQFKVNMNGYSTALQNVLMAASHERGYCQGINFIAAVFLLYQADEKEAFTLLCYLLKQRNMEILYNPKCSSLLEYMNYFEKRLRKHNKRIYKYFKQIDYSPVCYSIEWFTTCFIVTCPGELSSCVLDLILIGFDDIMIRVGLAMLDHLEEQLMKLDLETMQLEFKPLASKADPYDVMFRALTIPIPPNTRQNLLKTMAQNIEVMNPRAELVNTLRVTKTESEDMSTSLVPPEVTVTKPISKKSKKVKKGIPRNKKQKANETAGETSPLSPSPTPQQHPLVELSVDEYADDEGANTGSRKALAKKKASKGRAPISPVTPLTDHMKNLTVQKAPPGKTVDVRAAMRNDILNFKGILRKPAPQKSGLAPQVKAPSSMPTPYKRKQSRPETRFSKQFLKRIPNRNKANYNTPNINSDLADWDDSFTNTKEYVKRASVPVKRGPGIATTPTNSTKSTLGPAAVINKGKVEDSPLVANVVAGEAVKNRMLLDPESPLNVERQEKKEAKLMSHLFGAVPPPVKKNSSSIGIANTSSAAPSPVKAGPNAQPPNGKQEPKKAPLPPQVAKPAPAPPQSNAWLDKVVQDTIWFTTFGLVHAPPPVVKPAPPPVPVTVSKSVKEVPSWVLKKEMQRKEREDDDALVWIPGTQEGYDGDLSHSDADFEGEGGTRSERRSAHRAGTATNHNRSKILSIDIHGRSSLVEDLENPINILCDLHEKWFAEDNKANPSFKILNKQYHNEVNLAIRRRRNKKRNFKDKV